MTTIEHGETRDLLAEIRAALAQSLNGQAAFRERVAEEYPEDARNARSAYELRELAEELRANDVYDDTPALRKLLGLVTKHGLSLDCILPSDPATGFDASQYRFHHAGESDDDFLSRLANALEAEVAELEANP